MTISRDELQRMFPNASISCYKANLPVEGAGPAAKPEPVVRPVPLATGKVEKENSSRFLVRIVSVRKRLLDEDNLCAKYHTDLCRFAGIIPSDAPDRCHIETTQRRAEKNEEEHTVIEVFQL